MPYKCSVGPPYVIVTPPPLVLIQACLQLLTIVWSCIAHLVWYAAIESTIWHLHDAHKYLQLPKNYTSNQLSNHWLYYYWTETVHRSCYPLFHCFIICMGSEEPQFLGCLYDWEMDSTPFIPSLIIPTHLFKVLWFDFLPVPSNLIRQILIHYPAICLVMYVLALAFAQQLVLACINFLTVFLMLLNLKELS